jgi:hypothetical protein|nr:MAG TPA: hypothetical protein [Caudoviricetes sp.]
MAKPEFYPDWATEDTTLPSTGNTNKVRPKQVLREVGVDYGQLLTAEETNWLFNNTGQWVRYLADEYLDTIPLTYLPKDGTQLNFTGDITGTAVWSGTNVGTVELSSATLNAATSNPTANTLAKRDSNGAIAFTQVRVISPTNQNLYFGENLNAYRAVIGHINSDHSFSLSSLDGTAAGVQQTLTVYSDRIQISNPRSSSGQGSNAADLTRKDYVDNQDQTYWNNANNTFVAGIRLTQMYSKTISGGAGNNQLANSGGCCVGWHTEGSEPEGDTIFFRDIQQLIGGNWYSIGQLS